MNLQACVANVARVFSVPTRHIVSRSNLKEYARPRLALYWLGRERFGYSYPQIGRILHRDHSTVVDGYRRAMKLREDDELFRDRTDILFEMEAEQICPCCNRPLEDSNV